MGDNSTSSTPTVVTRTEETSSNTWASTTWTTSRLTTTEELTTSLLTTTGASATEAPGKRPPIPIIVGCSVAGLVIFVVFIICCCYKSKRCCGKEVSAKKMTPWTRLKKSMRSHNRANLYVESAPTGILGETSMSQKNQLEDPEMPIEKKAPEGQSDHKEIQEKTAYNLLVGGTTRESIPVDPSPQIPTPSQTSEPHLKKAKPTEDPDYYNLNGIPTVVTDDENYMAMGGAGNMKELGYITKEGKNDPKYTNIQGVKNSQGEENPGYVNGDEGEEHYENTMLGNEEEYYNTKGILVRKSPKAYLNDVVATTDSVVVEDGQEASYLDLQKDSVALRDSQETYDIVETYQKNGPAVHGSTQRLVHQLPAKKDIIK